MSQVKECFATQKSDRNVFKDSKHVSDLLCRWSLAPFEKTGRRNEAGATGVAGQLPGLPPEGVRLVHNLQDVAFGEAIAGVGTRDGRVLLRVIVHHSPDVQLRSRSRNVLR